MASHAKAHSGCGTSGCCESPMAKYWKQIMRFIFRDNMKYLFYELVIFLLPGTFYRFYIANGDYDFSTMLKFLTTSSLVGMAYWSHYNAKPHNDPGYLNWEDFRSEEEL